MILGIKALAETVMAFYETLVDEGADPVTAINLTEAFIRATFQGGKSNEA